MCLDLGEKIPIEILSFKLIPSCNGNCMFLKVHSIGNAVLISFPIFKVSLDKQSHRKKLFSMAFVP